MVTRLQEFHGFVATETQGKVRNSNFAEWSCTTQKALKRVGLELFKTDLSEPCKKHKVLVTVSPCISSQQLIMCCFSSETAEKLQVKGIQ